MMNIGNPEQAFKLAQIPNDGVGLARMEFIFADAVRVHPLALTRFATLPISVRREIERLTSGYVGQDRILCRHAGAWHRHDRGRLLAQAGDRALLRLQDQRICPSARWLWLRAARGEPDAGLAWRKPLLPS